MARNQNLRNAAARQGNRPSPAPQTKPAEAPVAPDATELETYVVIYNKTNTRVINPYLDLPKEAFVKIALHSKQLMFEHCDVTDLEDVTDTLAPAVLERMEPNTPVTNVVVEEWLSEQE